MKSALSIFAWLVVVGAILLAGCTSATSSQTTRTGRERLLARLHASQAKSQRIEAQMLATQQRWAAAYPAGSVTTPGEVVSHNGDADERAAEWQKLRAKLEQTRQEQQRLRAELRQVDRVRPAAT